MHEPLRLIDTALSDILQLTPLITEVYMQIHKQPDVHSCNQPARGNKQVFLCGEKRQRLSEISSDHLSYEKPNMVNKAGV